MRLLSLVFVMLVGCGPGTVTLAAHQPSVAVGSSSAVVGRVVPAQRGLMVFSASNGGVVAPAEVMTGDDGTAVTMVSSSTPGVVTVTARVGEASGTTTVTFTSSTTLRFSTSPANTQAQNLLRPVPVVVVEENGAVVSSSSAPITVSVTPGSCSAALDGTSLTMVNASQGSASFYGLKISTPATGCTLTATSGSFAPAVSSAFDIQ